MYTMEKIKSPSFSNNLLTHVEDDILTPGISKEMDGILNFIAINENSY